MRNYRIETLTIILILLLANERNCFENNFFYQIYNSRRFNSLKHLSRYDQTTIYENYLLVRTYKI